MGNYYFSEMEKQLNLFKLKWYTLVLCCTQLFKEEKYAILAIITQCMCILLWNLLWGNAMGTRGNTGTHLGADVTADAAQTLWTVWSNWCVKYHLINWENPANLIRELHITRAPLLLAIWKSHVNIDEVGLIKINGVFVLGWSQVVAG